MTTQNQLDAVMTARRVLRDRVWATELVLEDYEESTDEYKEAKAFLSQPVKDIVKDVVDNTMTELSLTCKQGKFASRKYVSEFVSKRLAKHGYVDNSDKTYMNIMNGQLGTYEELKDMVKSGYAIIVKRNGVWVDKAEELCQTLQSVK